jgi:hypothetical protein
MVKRKEKYYFTYLPATKHGIGKSRVSRDFSSLQKAMQDARKRQRARKIVQATFIKKKSSIDHQIVSVLTLKGKTRGGV